MDSERPKTGPGAEQGQEQAEQYDREIAQNAPETGGQGRPVEAFDTPSQAARWSVDGIAKAGTIGVIGVYPPTHDSFPIGQAMNKNRNIRVGNCPHRRFIPELIDPVVAGLVDPSTVLTQSMGISSAIAAYEDFDRREPGWTKVALDVVRVTGRCSERTRAEAERRPAPSSKRTRTSRHRPGSLRHVGDEHRAGCVRDRVRHPRRGDDRLRHHAAGPDDGYVAGLEHGRVAESGASRS